LAVLIGGRMQPFDPRRVLAPSANAHTVELDPTTLARLQAQAFAHAEAPPGYARPEAVKVKLRSGESLDSAFKRLGLSAEDAWAAANALGQAAVAGQGSFRAAIAEPVDGEGPPRLIGVSMRTGPASALTLSRGADGALRLRQFAEAVREELAVTGGRMNGSLYASALSAGATPELTRQLVGLFQHKLDFSRDIKRGDEFRLVFEREVTESGRTIDTGELLYAELAAEGAIHRFYRYQPQGAAKADYFDESGKSMRGFLLSTPVDGARVTSLFGLRRHPILGFTLMHQGIDFGAGAGTPVVAAGDGVVVEAGYNGGYGNWVKLRHSGGWETAYAHLSRYGRGVRRGMRIAQGQVVGYVGSTGRSTGPHLHYEIWRNGARINPKAQRVPQGVVLSGADLERFRQQKARIDGLIASAPGAAETPRLALAKLEDLNLKPGAPDRSARLRPREG
jgi:murein DD-endopeptidase MepM/ murein hydrolase activator NlpD